MHSSIIGAALFVAGALAVPFEKRAYATHTNVNVVYVTDVVTVTEGGSQPTATSAAENNHGNWGGWHSWGWGGSQTTTEVAANPTPTTQAQATSSPQAPQQPTSWTTEQPASQPTEQPTSAQSSAENTASQTVDPVQGTGAPTGYAGIALYAHNLHRANHSVPALTWSSSLASIAQEIAQSCSYAHNVVAGGGGYGQNIAAGVQPSNISAVITELFYNGEVGWYDGLYGQAQPPMTNFGHWGHFSQVVWKSTTQVGCYTEYCPNGLANTGGYVAPYFTVCNYKGPGNYANEYGANVLQPLGQPTANWNTGLNVNELPTSSSD